MDGCDTNGLLEAYEKFSSRTGCKNYLSFFFGVALGAMNSKVQNEGLIAAIEKLSSSTKQPEAAALTSTLEDLGERK